MIAIGVGCRRGCEANEIVMLVRTAMEALHSDAIPGLGRACRCHPRRDIASSPPTSPQSPCVGARDKPGHDLLGASKSIELRSPQHEAIGLFTIAEKRNERGLSEAAIILGLPLVFLDTDALRPFASGASIVSPRIEALHGLPSVAETAALAGAGEGATLLVPRMSTARATCAIAGPRP